MSDYEYELSPEEAHYIHQHEVDKQFEVFGEARMKETIGNEADDSDAQSFVNTVDTLSSEGGPYEVGGRTYKRRVIPRENGEELILWGNPEDHHGFGDMGEIDRSPSAVRNLKKRNFIRLKFKNGLPPGKYTSLEHMFVDRLTGEVKLNKEIIPKTKLGTYKSATKIATKDEVSEAIDIIAKAVSQEESGSKSH